VSDPQPGQHETTQGYGEQIDADFAAEMATMSNVLHLLKASEMPIHACERILTHVLAFVKELR
jgi:hypothetical protein